MRVKNLGAEASIYYKDEPDKIINSVYFSFGNYDEDTDTDSFGIPDPFIFFYVEDESDMKDLMDVNGGEDFVVVDYEIQQGRG